MTERPCQRIFGEEGGNAIHEFVQRRTGRICPCLNGDRCVLLDAAGDSPLLPDPDNNPPGDIRELLLFPKQHPRGGVTAIGVLTVTATMLESSMSAAAVFTPVLRVLGLG